MTRIVLAALLATPVVSTETVFVGPAAPQHSPQAPREEPTNTDESPSGENSPPDAALATVAPAPVGRPVLDRVLPSGVRVLVARDDSLPVASVILALEHGSEDDPEPLPGLHHALAYQLTMGNRRLPPGGVAAMVQDAGGIAFLATGPSQIRFESLAPVTLLDELIEAEAGRLRAPTVTESLWKEAIVSAKRDSKLRRTAPWTASARAHGAIGLAHRPRVVPEVLAKLDVATVEDELSRRARYEHATLVVVSPLPVEDVLRKVEAAFADLPKRARSVPTRDVRPSPGPLESPKSTGKTFVWGVSGTPQQRIWADAWCEALSRQRRGKDEPKPNRVRCAFDDDPRRPTLTVQVRTPGDPKTLLTDRLTRLAANERLLRAPRRRIARGLATEVATPLGLARRLAAGPLQASNDQTTVESVTGVTSLSGDPIPLETLMNPDDAVQLVGPSREAPPQADGTSNDGGTP